MRSSVFVKTLGCIPRIGLLSCLLSLSACGGGGGGGGANYTTSLTYTGNSSPATITSTNAQPIAYSAYNSGSLGTGPVGVLAIPTGSGDGSKILRIANLVAQTARSLSAGTTTPAGVTQSYPGDCGGYLAVTEDDSAGGGSIAFNDYCQSDSYGNPAFTIGGWVTFTINPIPLPTSGPITFTMPMNLLIRDETSGAVDKIDNYNVSLVLMLDSSGNLTGETISMSGTYYDRTSGYVTVSTETAFQFDLSGTPTAGALVVSSGSQRARLKVVSGGYTIEFDGGSGYGTPSPIYPWV